MMMYKIGTQSDWKSKERGSSLRSLPTMPKYGSTHPGGHLCCRFAGLCSHAAWETSLCYGMSVRWSVYAGKVRFGVSIRATKAMLHRAYAITRPQPQQTNSMAVLFIGCDKLWLHVIQYYTRETCHRGLDTRGHQWCTGHAASRR